MAVGRAMGAQNRKEALISKEKTGGKLPEEMGLDSRQAKRIDSTQENRIDDDSGQARESNQRSLSS